MRENESNNCETLLNHRLFSRELKQIMKKSVVKISTILSQVTVFKNNPNFQDNPERVCEKKSVWERLIMVQG